VQAGGCCKRGRASPAQLRRSRTPDWGYGASSGAPPSVFARYGDAPDSGPGCGSTRGVSCRRRAVRRW